MRIGGVKTSGALIIPYLQKKMLSTITTILIALVVCKVIDFGHLTWFDFVILALTIIDICMQIAVAVRKRR